MCSNQHQLIETRSTWLRTKKPTHQLNRFDLAHFILSCLTRDEQKPRLVEWASPNIDASVSFVSRQPQHAHSEITVESKELVAGQGQGKSSRGTRVAVVPSLDSRQFDGSIEAERPLGNLDMVLPAQASIPVICMHYNIILD